jgi:hypothetical protein
LGLWRDILRVLGFTSDARVQISAPGIDVVITGDPEQVRQLLSVVKHELERSAARRELEGRRKSIGSSQVVRPTELDEMDSPYVLPEAMVLPVEESTTGELVRTPVDDETFDEEKPRIPAIPAARAEVRVTRAGDDAETAEVTFEPRPEAATLLPDDATKVEVSVAPRNGSREKKDPSGPVFVADSNLPFATDGGPTLTPGEGSGDLVGTDPEVKELDSDPGA